MRLHFCIVIGHFKFENWCLYRWRAHQAVKNPKVNWYDWDRVW